MTPLHLELPGPLAASLDRCARRYGLTPEAFTLRLLEQLFDLAADDPLTEIERARPSESRNLSAPDESSADPDR